LSTPRYDGASGPRGPAGRPAHGPSHDAAEDHIRYALRDAASAVEPSPWPATAVKERAARRRRTRRILATLPVAAAITACAALMSVESHDRAPDAPAPPAVSSPPRPGPTQPPPTDVPTVRVVSPRSVGENDRMKLEPDRRCTAQSDDEWTCESVADGNRTAGTVSSQNVSDQDGTVYAPLYVGPERPARMTVTAQGHTYPVQVVTLAGHPGYAAGYVVGPPPPSPGVIPRLTVTVYDSRGKVMASLTSLASGLPS